MILMKASLSRPNLALGPICSLLKLFNGTGWKCISIVEALVTKTLPRLVKHDPKASRKSGALIVFLQPLPCALAMSLKVVIGLVAGKRDTSLACFTRPKEQRKQYFAFFFFLLTLTVQKFSS